MSNLSFKITLNNIFGILARFAHCPQISRDVSGSILQWGCKYFTLAFPRHLLSCTPRNVRISLSVQLQATSFELVPSLWEGMSTGEILVSEADGNGGIMGEFWHLFLISSCPVACFIVDQFRTLQVLTVGRSMLLWMGRNAESWNRSGKHIECTEAWLKLSITPNLVEEILTVSSLFR